MLEKMIFPFAYNPGGVTQVRSWNTSGVLILDWIHLQALMNPLRGILNFNT